MRKMPALCIALFVAGLFFAGGCLSSPKQPSSSELYCAQDSDCELSVVFDGCCPTCGTEALNKTAALNRENSVSQNPFCAITREIAPCPMYDCYSPRQKVACLDNKCQRIIEQQNIAESPNCAGSGKPVNPDSSPKLNLDYPDNCCAGLKKSGGGFGWNGTSCEGITGTPYQTCISCGDGICKNDARENYCTCPEDCAKPKACASTGENVQGEGSSWTQSFYPKECCVGLKKISDKNFTPGLAICSDCGDGVCEAGIENERNCEADCLKCAKEGEREIDRFTVIVHEELEEISCCDGLKPIIVPNEGDLGSKSICTKCGDLICKSPENKDNCPADCK